MLRHEIRRRKERLAKRVSDSGAKNVHINVGGGNVGVDRVSRGSVADGVCFRIRKSDIVVFVGNRCAWAKEGAIRNIGDDSQVQTLAR